MMNTNGFRGYETIHQMGGCVLKMGNQDKEIAQLHEQIEQLKYALTKERELCGSPSCGCCNPQKCDKCGTRTYHIEECDDGQEFCRDCFIGWQSDRITELEEEIAKLKMDGLFNHLHFCGTSLNSRPCIDLIKNEWEIVDLFINAKLIGYSTREEAIEGYAKLINYTELKKAEYEKLNRLYYANHKKTSNNK